MLRYVDPPRTSPIVDDTALKVPKISWAAQKAHSKKVAKVWYIARHAIATVLILLISRAGRRLENRRIIER